MKTVSFALAAIAVIGAGTSAARAQLPPAPAPRYLITIDEQRLSDPERAILVKAIARDVPAENWPQVRVGDGDSVLGLINRYYDIYPWKGQDPFSKPLPITTETVRQLIRDANALPDGDVIKVGQSLRIPPIPVRPKSGHGIARKTRAFDPQMWRSYALVGSTGVTGFKAATLQPVAHLQSVRDVTSTVVALSFAAMTSTASLNSDAFGLDVIRTQPPSDPDAVQLRLLESAAQCSAAAGALASSPYLGAAKTRIANALPALTAAASARHLRLIDFDFGSDHGARVKSAALWLLHSVGADVVGPGGVAVFEMNPADAKDDLDAAITDYLKAGLDKSSAAWAALWVLTAPRERGKTVYSIHPVVVQAELWRALSRGEIVSLSWQVSNPTGVRTLQMEDLLHTKGSVVFVAAGNDADQEVEDLFPQSVAVLHPEFVNVTYGAVDGEPFGSITGTERGGRVDVMAPGCGITYGALTPSHSGSSFASPIVATAAWLKMLLDRTASASNLRREVLEASLLVPPRPKTTTISGGYFDPARLIAGVGAHYLDPGRKHLVPITSLDLDAGSCGKFGISPGGHPTVDLIVYEDQAKYFTLVRREVAGFKGVEVERPCELTSLKGSIRGPNGLLTISGPNDFVLHVGHLTF